jgi:hypothetical protein
MASNPHLCVVDDPNCAEPVWLIICAIVPTRSIASTCDLAPHNLFAGELEKDVEV